MRKTSYGWQTMSKQSDLSATNAGIWTRRCVTAITVSRMSNAVLSQIHIKSRKDIDIMTKIIKTVSVWLPVILLVAVLTAAPTAAQGSGSVEHNIKRKRRSRRYFSRFRTSGLFWRVPLQIRQFCGIPDRGSMGGLMRWETRYLPSTQFREIRWFST